MEPSMNSGDDISEKMESMSLTTTQRVVRRNKRVPKNPLRFCPYSSFSHDLTNDEKQREEIVGFGVQLSVLVAKAMFLFSDDICSVLCFCFLIFKRTGNQQGPVVKRLVCVMEHFFAEYIKPKNGVYKDGGKMLHWEQINTFQQGITLGFKWLDHFVRMIVGTGGLKNMYVFKRCILMKTKNLEDKLKSVNEANGFPRETIESNILHFWKNLFETANPQLSRELEVFTKSEDEDILTASEVVEEALATTIPQLRKSLSETTPQVPNQPRITTYPELFRPLIYECKRYNLFVRQLSSLNL